MSIFRDPYIIHKIGSNLMRKKIPLIPKFLNVIKRIIYPCADIPFTAHIGNGTKFPHRAIGVIIHSEAMVGKECKIETSVVIGGRNRKGAPKIGDYCFIGTGASILGGVTIGDDCMIGAGAVVLTDIPSGEVWEGVPAKYIKDTPQELLQRFKN